MSNHSILEKVKSILIRRYPEAQKEGSKTNLDEAAFELSQIIMTEVGNQEEALTDQLANHLVSEDEGGYDLSKKIVDKLSAERISELKTRLADVTINEKDLAQEIIKKQEEAEAKKTMPTFIQALYGVVIGIGSLKFIGSTKELTIYNTLPDTNRLVGAPDGPVSPGELVFRFVFFAFTVLVVAHDWYTYHNSDEEKPVVGTAMRFWFYVPQLGSLFFLGQMLNSASVNEMFPWFFWGFWYTLFNVWHSSQIKVVYKRVLPDIYFVHFAICIAAIFILNFHKKNPDNLWCAQWIILGGTMLIVILLWEWREKVKGKKSQNPFVILGSLSNFWGNKILKISTVVAFVAGIVWGLYWVWQHNKPMQSKYDPLLSRSDLDTIKIPIKIINKKIDDSSKAINDQVKSARDILNNELNEINNQITRLLNRRIPKFPDSLFKVLGVKLDSLHKEQNASFANQEQLDKLIADSTRAKFNIVSNKFDSLVTSQHEMASRLGIAYTGNIDSTLNRVDSNLSLLKKRLKKKLKRKNVISDDDIEFLQNRIDSIRNVFHR